jgi:predicted aspartyl protease
MSVKFDPTEGLIVVLARLSGPNGSIVVRLALDTGATGTLDWVIVASLGYDPAAIRERVQITTGSSVEFVPRVMVREIQALGQKRRKFPILCHTLPPTTTVDGVVGLDFLRDKCLTVDFRAGGVTLD